MIFGGAGTRDRPQRPGRHVRRAATPATPTSSSATTATSSAWSARPTARFLTFNYDNYGPSQDHPAGGHGTLDYTPARRRAADIGGADYVHGEGGDDFVHGMAGNDVLFGEGQDDDLIGGAGHDRIYGGTGEDGVLGDDGRFIISRNGLTEPLYGVTAVNAQVEISLPGPFTGAWIYITGRLQHDGRR